MNGIANVTIGGKKCRIVSNALLPRLYRFHFGRDFMVDLKHLYKDYQEGGEDAINSGIFEDITWLMLKQGGEDVGDTIDEWLETIDVFDLYGAMQTVVELLQASQKTTSKPKKK